MTKQNIPDKHNNESFFEALLELTYPSHKFRVDYYREYEMPESTLLDENAQEVDWDIVNSFMKNLDKEINRYTKHELLMSKARFERSVLNYDYFERLINECRKLNNSALLKMAEYELKITDIKAFGKVLSEQERKKTASIKYAANMNRRLSDEEKEAIENFQTNIEALDEAKKRYRILTMNATVASYMIRSVKELINRYLPIHEISAQHVDQSSEERYTKGECIDAKSLKNTFNDMPRDKVLACFMLLATTKNKNNEPYLSEEHVKEFVERAFYGKEFTEDEKLEINAGQGGIGKVKGFFHLYYKACKGSIKGQGFDKDCNYDKYVKLLTEYFKGWEERCGNNFRPYHSYWPEMPV